MSRTHWWALAAWLAVGCFDADIRDGTVACGEEGCPPGMECADDDYCYRDPVSGMVPPDPSTEPEAVSEGETESQSVPAPAPLPAPGDGLTVVVEGNGSVESSDGSMLCHNECTLELIEGTVVQLLATPRGSWSFTGWAGDCSEASQICSLTVAGMHTVIARFSQQQAMRAAGDALPEGLR